MAHEGRDQRGPEEQAGSQQRGRRQEGWRVRQRVLPGQPRGGGRGPACPRASAGLCPLHRRFRSWAQGTRAPPWRADAGCPGGTSSWAPGSHGIALSRSGTCPQSLRDSSRLTWNQGPSGPQAQFYLRRDRHFGSMATGERLEHLLCAPQAPTSTPLSPVGLATLLTFGRALWVDSLFSPSYLSRLLRIYTISVITSNYIIIINTCNGLNRTCNYSGSRHKNPCQGSF